MKFIINGFLLLFAVFFILACEEEMSDVSPDIESKYIGMGSKLAKQTFDVMSGKLKNAIEEGGVPYALKYCNLHAYPIIDSLSKMNNAEIRRTTLKVRNQKNSPDGVEEKILNIYKIQWENGEQLKPMVKSVGNDKIMFFSPITISNPVCLNCHGQVGELVSSDNDYLIKDIYPGDEATGYKMGDFRGIWSISFTKN